MSEPSSPPSIKRRPRDLYVDNDSEGADECHGAVLFNTSRVKRIECSPVVQLLNDIAYQWQKERQRAFVRSGRTRRRDDGHLRAAPTTTTTGTASVPNLNEQYEYDGAASAYWWTDLFLRHFVFDGDNDNKTVAPDSDDLLFFVRRRHRHNRRKSKHRHRPSSQRPRLVAYDTQVYRKQNQQQTTLLPISDPAILWRHTVCLNTIVHRMQYTLTVAVCVRVPRKSASVAGVDYYYDENSDEFGFDDGRDQEYDLQVLSRHVHTVYASTSGRRMDTDKGPRERPVYPAVCWVADDYAEAFRTVIVCPGQTVCAELVASWLGSTVADKHGNNDNDNDGDGDVGNFNALFNRGDFTTAPKRRAVLFSGAIPYAAVRATYECKMSLYRDAERQRRKRRQQNRKRGCGKKSSLGAALSASLTALFTGGKDPSGRPNADHGDNDYYYGASGSAATAADGRVEYVTVRGCRPLCDDDIDEDDDHDGDDYELTPGDGHGLDVEFDIDHDTKGLAQMAVALSLVQPPLETHISAAGYDDYGDHHHHRNSVGSSIEEVYGYDCDDGADRAGNIADTDCVARGHQRRPQTHQHQLEPSSYAAPSTASEPGDFYDYGWDYETAASSGHQTPQTPMSYHYQQQQQRQLKRQRRRGGRPRRLSDPCSTSVYDMMDDDYDDDDGDNVNSGWTPQYQCYQQQKRTIGNSEQFGGGSRRKHNYYQQQPTSGGGERTAMVMTPGRQLPNRTQRPHRAWSESDGLDRCGVAVQRHRSRKNRQYPPPLPPPPVPYYCAAEATASGFVQYAHKSPAGWWTRTKNKRRRRRRRMMRGSRPSDCCGGQKGRSASDNCYRNCDTGGSDSDDTDGDANSDGQDSDGEFIGTLAVAAVVGHDPEREWAERGLSGNPVADWDRYSDDNDSVTDDDDDNGGSDDDDIMIEWTTEIVATELGRTRSRRNAAALSRAITLYENDFDNWCGRPSTPSGPSTARHQPQQQQLNRQQQQQRRRQLPQLRPQPLEPPPPPPAFSVAFTAVACPWWTVLSDLMLANSVEMQPSSSNRTVSALPLLTFD